MLTKKSRRFWIFGYIPDIDRSGTAFKSLFICAQSAKHVLVNSVGSYNDPHINFIQFCGVSVGGIVVSIAAFQAVDPGSIPGRRILCEYSSILFWIVYILNMAIFGWKRRTHPCVLRNVPCVF